MFLKDIDFDHLRCSLDLSHLMLYKPFLRMAMVTVVEAATMTMMLEK